MCYINIYQQYGDKRWIQFINNGWLMISLGIIIPNILGNVTIHALGIPINNMIDSIKNKLQ